MLALTPIKSSQLKAKFANIYGLKQSDLTFKFDGSTIDDEDSPESLDLEDDDLIHVKVLIISYFLSSSSFLYFFGQLFTRGFDRSKRRFMLKP